MSQLTIQSTSGTLYNVISTFNPNSNDNGSATALIGVLAGGKASILSRQLYLLDVSAIPANATITSATLTLVNTGGNATPGAIYRCYRVTRTWTSTGATWNSYDGVNNWTTAGGDYDTSGGDSYTQPDYTSNLVFSNLAALVADALASRGGLLRLVLRESTEGSVNKNITVATPNYGTPGSTPQLVINYTLPPLGGCNMSGGMQELSGNLGG
jgi:hypothetical protein